MKLLSKTAILAASMFMTAGCLADEHPRLLMTPADVRDMVDNVDESPSFVGVLEETQAVVDEYFAEFPDVPQPRDAGGGYTHERHKRNGISIMQAGTLYLITGEDRYADHARDLLLAYAEMYPSLGEHPRKKEQTPGRLFWQSLNESMWLVYSIQGYDAIYDYLDEETRATIEGDLLRPMAEFLSVGQPETFDKIHNHGTWAVAAVGMTGYVIGDDSYVQRALYGLNGDGESGFLRQLDLLFSPDGYYNEGPYYQRFALMPFVVFARAIELNDPDIGVFRHRDGVLLKAIYACIDLSYANLFFPINDAIKDKGLATVELRYGLSIAYALTGDQSLLDVARQQGTYVLTGDAFAMARAIDNGAAEPYPFDSILFRDGADGDRGALAVLRHGEGHEHQALVLKATAQGLGHGHFDRLNFLYFDQGDEIIFDYGAARFLNVEQKYGGHYLPENTTWAKQTVAHNTLVVDEQSHFGGSSSAGEEHNPEILIFESNADIQIAGAIMNGAYEDVSFRRTQVMLNGVAADSALVVDILTAQSSNTHQYDLPWHFNGQIVATSHQPESSTDLAPLGDDNGYQHLWRRAAADLDSGDSFGMTWLYDGRFYSLTSLTSTDTQAVFAELGANDPNFNLLRGQALILRVPEADTYSFVSVLESHGEYNGTDEYTVGNYPQVTAVERYSENGADVIRLLTESGGETLLALSYDPDEDAQHSVTVGTRTITWSGYYRLIRSEGASP